ncbi:MAG: peptidase T [Oscillospiraceae bacterium]|nr:peptidase T [Oscillospiraceae bacterium]
MEDVLDRFLRYVKIDTQSEENGLHPSTKKQFDLAGLLTEELRSMGASEVDLDEEYCYVYAAIPSNLPEGTAAPRVGFLAHMDTSNAVSGEGVKPRVVKFTGADIDLGGDGKYILGMKEFPFLKDFVGQELVVADGSTLLGADDKAGVAEIMAMAEYLLTHPEVKHGKICICFTPDEEVGNGVAKIDLGRFGADFGYTVDGGPLGGMEYENFNAASGLLTVYGRSSHPGSAKGNMKNAILIGMEFQNLLPVFENPMYTEGYEGFYHLCDFHGDVEKATLSYIIRDHDREKFAEKKARFRAAADFLNGKYGAGTCTAELKDSYYNMKEVILPHMEIVEKAKEAMVELGIAPVVSPIRGGTDGAMLSHMGLPCPNLCTGGMNFHGRYEFASVPQMRKIVELLVRIAEKHAEA